tara:strand:+ start:180 stop:308 length:129 start_codon:yes stop_codon:yes gene_type:complete
MKWLNVEKRKKGRKKQKKEEEEDKLLLEKALPIVIGEGFFLW